MIELTLTNGNRFSIHLDDIVAFIEQDNGTLICVRNFGSFVVQEEYDMIGADSALATVQ